MKGADYFLAAVPEPVTLLGLRLRPFSLGHVIILIGGQPDFNDLAASVFVCSQTYADGLASFNDPDLPRFMSKWAAKLMGISWLTKLGLSKPKLIDFPAKCAAFAKYIEDGSKMPAYDYNPDEVRSMECPGAQLVKASLMSEMNFTETELLDRPWGLCLWDYVTLKAIKGRVRIWEKDTLNEAQEFANRLAEKLNARKGVNGAA
jgi:hypothetical protein